MSLRNVTLTAIAALSFGMAAHAQTTTITVPMGDAATAAPPAAGPGTTVTVQNGQQSVTNSATPAAETPAADAAVTPANPAAMDAADTSATAEAPAPAAPQAQAAANAETGTAATGMDATTPTPTPASGEPPAAPKEGLPAGSAAAQVNAPVPATTLSADGAAPAETAAPATEAAPAEGAAPTEAAPGAEAGAPTAIQNPDAVQTAPAGADAGTATAPAGEATEPAAADGHAAPAGDHAAAGDAGGSHATHQEIHDVAFSFEGPFGKYDQFQLQRGLQVYTEVCAACHGMKQVPLRTLHDAGGPGLPEDQMRAYAKAMTIVDPATGEERPREPTDHFPTVTGEGMGPDLSLMAKARAGFHGPYGTGLSQLFNGIGGPEYIYSILTGYTGETKEQAGATFYENKAFPGGWISMPPPLADDQVTFADGAPADLASASKDVAAFLMWTAEPKMMDRKQAGLVAVLFLAVLSSLLYLTNKRLWWPIKHRKDVIGDGR